MGFCTSCGARLADGVAFCTNCGKKITPQSAGQGGSSAGGPGGIKTGTGGQVGGSSSGQNNRNDQEKKKSPLVPFLIAFGSALAVIGAVILILYLFKVWPFNSGGSDTRPPKTTTEAADSTERTRRADRESESKGPEEKTTEAAPAERTTPAPHSETIPRDTDPPETDPPETAPTETEPYFNKSFLGVWYGDQGTVFTLFENGSVQYDDGGTAKNRLTGTWTLDEETGRFEMDLFGSGNRFYLYVTLPEGSDATVMRDMAMNWDKSSVDVWYYESFFRQRPDKIVEGDDRVPQVKPYMP